MHQSSQAHGRSGREPRHLGANVGPEPEALLFTSPRGDPIRYSHFRPLVWLPAPNATDSVPDDLRSHELRHTAATLMIAQGAHPKAIPQHLGHSSITVTPDRYGHLFPGELDAWPSGWTPLEPQSWNDSRPHCGLSHTSRSSPSNSGSKKAPLTRGSS